MRRAAPALVAALALVIAGCASNPKPPVSAPGAPRFPDYPRLEIPANLRVSPEILTRHETAWHRLQAGDLRNAGRDYNDVLKQSDTFYPAEAGLGFVALAGREFKQAAARFSSTLAKNERYLPAWLGMAEAQVGLGHDAEAIGAMERALEIDPKRETLRGRLELLRFKEVQTLIASGQRARQAGRLDEARQLLDRALTLSPSSAVILREIGAVETAQGSLDARSRSIRTTRSRTRRWARFSSSASSIARPRRPTDEPRPSTRARRGERRAPRCGRKPIPARFPRSSGIWPRRPASRGRRWPRSSAPGSTS
jgi:tetratricopeptide (TPR) repeat protein